MTPGEIAILLKALTDMILMLRENGITEVDLDAAIREEEVRREKLFGQI